MAVPPIIHAEHRVVRGLRDAGAVTPGAAQPFSGGRRLDERALLRLLEAGAVRDVGGGRYYLDTEAYRDFSSARRKRALTMVSVVILVMAVLALAGIIGS